MHTVRIDNADVNQAIEFKHQLIQDGLVLNQDFEWVWQPAKWDDFAGWVNTTRNVQFHFKDPVLATFYQLKWLR